MKVFFLILTIGTTACLAQADEIVVRNAEELRSALRALEPDTTLKIGPVEYPGGHSVFGIAKLTIEALDPQEPPIFKGGKTGFQFSRCAALTLRYLRIHGQSLNGLNIDDGGDLTHPVVGITLDHVEVSDIGPDGNHDGIKCSGLDKATIRDCTITGWGGQGIDVRNNTIEGSPCSAAFVGVDGAEFTDNTLLYPEKWIFRILQETKEAGFEPCRNVLIKDNRITFRRAQVQSEVNIGVGTLPETFQFEYNSWLAEDKPQASKPKLPVEEIGGVYGQADGAGKERSPKVQK